MVNNLISHGLLILWLIFIYFYFNAQANLLWPSANGH